MSDDKASPTTETRQPQKPSLSLLASEMFGSEFKGEVKDAEPNPDKDKNKEPLAGEEPGENEPGAEPSDDDAAAAGEDDGEHKGEETDEATISSFSELIEHLEADPEWLQGLKVEVKVDGKPAEATFSDLVKSYQIGQAAEHRLEEAKSKAKALTQELADKSKALEGQFATVAKLIENAEGLLDQDVKATDWTKLRDQDPAEYAAKKAEVAERRDTIANMKRDAVSAWQDASARTQAERAAQLTQHLQAEQSALLEKLPEWRDDAKAKTEKVKLAEYLIGQGFSQQDVMGASDHRLILLGRKAMLYDEGKGKVEAARKKVAKVPKVMKPGASKPQDQLNQERIDQSRARLKQSGAFNDALAYLKAKRGGK